MATGLRRWLGRGHGFAHAKRGNVTTIFALALIPMILAAGAGIDFFRAAIVRSEMASALDSAALAVGASTDLSTEEMTALAKKFFDANYRLDSSYGTVSNLTVSVGDQQIVITASDDVPTIFIKLAGIDTLSIATSTTVVWGQVKLWVSLVLDNTGSMAYSGKMTALKSASQTLLGILRSAASSDGDVRVAIIPFNKDVNLGTSYYTTSWIDWSLYGSCNISSITDKSTCESTYGTWTASTNTGGNFGGFGGNNNNSNTSGTCNISSITNKTTCQSTTGTWTTGTKSSWNGCVTDRGKTSGPYNNYDVLNTTPTSSDTYTYFPAEQYSNCPQALMALTSVGTSSSTSTGYTSLSNEITSMKSVGSTNQAIGLVWGWHAMTQGLPLSPPTLPDDTNRVIILLSDGINTQDRWAGDGSSDSTGTADARMALACTNAKADGITIYTVFVDTDNLGTSSTGYSVLKSCATSSSYFYDLTSASQISAAFAAIGKEITNLRVSQ